jgi:hypothetical protein
MRSRAILVLNAYDGPSPPYTSGRSAVVAMDGVGMDIVKGVISAIVMFAAIAVVIGLLAAMFMIVFSIATGVDEKMQD